MGAARELKSYPDLLAGLAKLFAIPIVVQGRARHVSRADADTLAHLVWCRRETDPG